jgi:hypothetical protein
MRIVVLDLFSAIQAACFLEMADDVLIRIFTKTPAKALPER